MVWTGKALGAALGFAVTHSAWGAVVGAAIGHAADTARNPARGARRGAADTRVVFFRTTFELMGRVAKADGRVSEAQIEAARALMREFALGAAEVDTAIACFRAGKSPGYDAVAALASLRSACEGRPDLLREFLGLQLRAGIAGNGLSTPSRAVLLAAAERLGVGGIEFAHLESVARARAGRRTDAGPGTAPRQRTMAECYQELEIAPSSSDQDVKRAYRRQMSRHHPDKLVAKGLPESMAQIAKEKTQRIQEAYETIRTARGMR